MDWKLMLSLGVPALVVVLGWFFAHWLTARRELASRKREARLKALEAAYMRLATSSNREDVSPESIEKLETFVSEIQLYGTPHHIKLMGEMVESYKRREVVSYDALLASLRDAIRKQLELEPVTGPVWWFRLTRLQAKTQGQTAESIQPTTSSNVVVPPEKTNA